MPTILSHPAVALGLHRWFGRLPRAVIIAGAIGSILPDADVAGFAMGIPYGSTFGHRGFTHSIVFALLASTALLLITRPQHKLATFAFLFACTMSHGVLDALTDGGRGVAFFSPLSNHRYFFPWRPIRVSPIGALSMDVLISELKWVWAPMSVLAIAPRILRRSGARSQGEAAS